MRTVLGFTGTREGATAAQMAYLYSILEERASVVRDDLEVHHGACIGVDASVHSAALSCSIRVHVWPPTNTALVDPECLVPHPLVTVHPNMPYLNRNREIVRAATTLIGFPKQNEEPEPFGVIGGTWYTIGFARRVDKPVIICFPNGEAKVENPRETTR